MSQTAVVILLHAATCFIRVGGISLENDYYYSAEPPWKTIKDNTWAKYQEADMKPEVGWKNDPPTMLKEDEVAKNIFDMFMKDAKNHGCVSLESFIGKYAEDNTTWDAEQDANNSEYHDHQGDKEANGDAQSIRDGLKNALKTHSGDKGTLCKHLFHLITCDFGGIRMVSPFEFVFKKGKFQDGKPLALSMNMTSNASSAYFNTKFKVWGTDDAKEDKKAFMFDKGKARDGMNWTMPPAHCGYGGGISPNNSALANFFNEDFHDSGGARFVTNNQCNSNINGATKKGVCVEKKKTPDEEIFCALIEGACKYAADRGKGKNAKEKVNNYFEKQGRIHPHCPAKTFLVRNELCAQSESMVKCNVPYVGGVSGSILEQIAFYVDRGGILDDKLLLVLMSVLNLSGHHSLGEAFATTREFLSITGYLKGSKLKDVPSPISLKEPCNDEFLKTGGEDKFLEALETVVTTVFR